MNNQKPPDWLLETQNKSWEPEILISGITLTFLFILSKHIYNFYGMLIQDFGVYDAIGKNLYIISIIILTGLKLILVIHLILRGIWTGFVGLSYVFPEGVNKQKLRKKGLDIDYHRPEKYVIKIEKICSLLFSFIFSSITYVLGFFVIFAPIIILFLMGLDLKYIHIITLYVILPLVLILSVFMALLDTKFKNTKLKQKLENSIFNNIISTYLTNLGVVKTAAIFIIYFVIIGLLSISAFSKFDFENEKSIDISTVPNMICLNNDHYKISRDQNLRISRAMIDQFRVTVGAIELFISFYKEDLYTIKKLEKNRKDIKEWLADADSGKFGLQDLYKISIDNKTISELRWYYVNDVHTNQKGIITKIPLDSLEPGYHELKIDKIYWKVNRDKMKLIKNWDVIPFELKKSLKN